MGGCYRGVHTANPGDESELPALREVVTGLDAYVAVAPDVIRQLRQEAGVVSACRLGGK